MASELKANVNSGFELTEQELKYNLTVFDLLMTLAARVNASLNSSKLFS